VVSPLLYGTEKQSFIAKYGTAVAVLNIALDLILIPKFAALGAAAANCTAQVAGVVGGTLYVIHGFRVSFPWKSTVTIYAAGAIALAPAAYLANRAHSGIATLVGSIALAAVIYLALLVAAGQLGRQDLNVLRRALLTKARPVKSLEAVDPA
jgi:O-antigen/teichoic acid export membrane protein